MCRHGFALALLVFTTAFCLPEVASAQSSWDVTIVSATGTMQMIQGRTYRAKAIQSPFLDKLHIGAAKESLNGTFVNVGACHSLVFGDSSVVIVIEKADMHGRLAPFSTAVLKTPGPGQSFNGTVPISDGGTVTISVTANP